MATQGLAPLRATLLSLRSSPQASAGQSESTLAAQRLAWPALSYRDRRTLEIRQFLPLPRRKDQETAYELDAYFYFPESFGISSETWPREHIYRDVGTYLRLHAPGLPLAELADLENANNPGTLLRRQLPMLMTENAPSAESLGVLAQLLGAELVDAAVGEVASLRRLIQAVEEGGFTSALEAELERTCTDVLRALGSVRRLRAKTSAYRALTPPALLDGLAFAEEYACAMVDQQFAELARLIDGSKALHDGRGSATRLRIRLAAVCEQINRHRLEVGFATPWDKMPEYFSYRMGLIKDELERALYVDTRALARDPFYRNSAAMVAAGLAATWATLAQVPMLTSDLSAGNRTWVLGLAIGAYVLKDRIKEWTRALLSSRILRWDHDRRIVGDALARIGFGEFGGRARERIRYISESQIPKEVSALRATHRTVQGIFSETEHVLHCRRRLSFRCGAVSVPPGFGVQELFRLSLEEIIKRLDAPVSEVSYYDYQTGKFQLAQVPKVYHMNVVHVTTDLTSNQQICSRTRVVLNQQGIVRLDPIADVHREDIIYKATQKP